MFLKRYFLLLTSDVSFIYVNSNPCKNSEKMFFGYLCDEKPDKIKKELLFVLIILMGVSE